MRKLRAAAVILSFSTLMSSQWASADSSLPVGVAGVPHLADVRAAVPLLVPSDQVTGGVEVQAGASADSSTGGPNATGYLKSTLILPRTFLKGPFASLEGAPGFDFEGTGVASGADPQSAMPTGEVEARVNYGAYGLTNLDAALIPFAVKGYIGGGYRQRLGLGESNNGYAALGLEGGATAYFDRGSISFEDRLGVEIGRVSATSDSTGHVSQDAYGEVFAHPTLTGCLKITDNHRLAACLVLHGRLAAGFSRAEAGGGADLKLEQQITDSGAKIYVKGGIEGTAAADLGASGHTERWAGGALGFSY